MQTLNVFNNSIVSKVYNCYFLVLSAHEEKRVNGLPLLYKYESNAVDIFIYYTVWLTVVKPLKFTLWPDLNLTVGLDINFS